MHCSPRWATRAKHVVICEQKKEKGKKKHKKPRGKGKGFHTGGTDTVFEQLLGL